MPLQRVRRALGLEPVDAPVRRSAITIRAALFAAFGLSLGLWLFAGWYFTLRLAAVTRDAEATNARYMRAQEALSTVRAQTLLGSIYVRDALLDPAPSTVEEYRRQIQKAYEGADAALRAYQPVIDSPEEREHISRLRREVDDFRATLVDVLATDRSAWIASARDLLGRRIVPQRQVVIGVSEQVQALNRAEFVEQQAHVATIYRETERHVWTSLGVALAANLAVGLLATLYAGRLERGLQLQRERDRQNAHDLQRLSAKIVSAQEDERRHIARELHDEVGQVLTAIKVELSMAQRAIDAAGGPAHMLDPARAIADRALTTVRTLSHLLHPAVLDDLGLPAAIDSYVREFSIRHGIAVDWRHDGIEGRVTPAAEAAAYRIVQEALTNVAQHAQAATCRLHLQRLPASLLLTIDDDGRGFDPDAARPDGRPGLGLLSMRERVAQLAGSLRIESAPGRGTRVTAVLPAGRRNDIDDKEIWHGEPAHPAR